MFREQSSTTKPYETFPYCPRCGALLINTTACFKSELKEACIAVPTSHYPPKKKDES